MKGYIVPLLGTIGILLVVIIAVVFVVGLASGGSIGNVIGDIGDWAGGIGGGRDYKIEISNVKVVGTAKEGKELIIEARFACDYEEPCTFIARGALEPEKTGIYQPGQLISGSVCCKSRASEATEQITLDPDEYRTIQFAVTVPTETSYATCGGYQTSYYSKTRVYYAKVNAYNSCYGTQLEDTAPIKVVAGQGTSAPVNYETVTSADGPNIHHYYRSIKVDGAICSRITSTEYNCPYGTWLAVDTEIKNNNEKNIQFLSEAIIHPAENYDPYNVLGQFLLASKSCCGDSFSYGWWIRATPGASNQVKYALQIPHSNIYGKCNSRNYYSQSRQYYLKISDYTDCGGTQVQDLAPILIRFGS